MATVIDDDIVLAGWTMDALFPHGRWAIRDRKVPVPDIPFPHFKVERDDSVWVTDVDGNFIRRASSAEQGLLDFRFSRAPIGFQKAFEALNSIGDWEDHFDRLTPQYARLSRVRPDSSVG